MVLVDDHPRKYPQLAAFINSDENLSAYRRYRVLRIRLLLYLQDEISALEEDLIELDDGDRKKQEIALVSRERDEEIGHYSVRSGNELYEKIDNKLKEYDDLVKSLKTPSSRNAKENPHFVKNHNSVVLEESAWIQRSPDLVAVSTSVDRGWFDSLVDDIVDELAKARSNGNTIGTFHSAAQRLLSSRDIYNKHRNNAPPPPSVGIVATEPTQTATSAATSARPSSTSSVQPSSYTSPGTESCLKSLLSCPKPLYSNRSGYLLAIWCLVSRALADEDSAILTPKPGPPWPLSEGPPGLGDTIMAIMTAISITGLSYSVRNWQKFQDPFLWGLSLGFSSLGGFLGLLQVYLGQHFARMSHRINGHEYTMSFHLWLPIFVLTGLFAFLCMKASPMMYNQNTQLPGFPFAIPCFGVSVLICVYLGYLLRKLWDSPLLPRWKLVRL